MENSSSEKIRSQFTQMLKSVSENKMKIIYDFKELLIKSVERAHDLTRFIVLLSVTIVGLIIPITIKREVLESEITKYLLLTSYILLFFVIIYGIFILIYVASKDLRNLPKLLDKHMNDWEEEQKKIYEVIINPTEEKATSYFQHVKELVDNKEKEKNKDKIPWSDIIFYGSFIIALILFTITIIMNWFN